MALAFTAGRAVAQRRSGPLRLVTAGHAVSTLIVIAWGLAMGNFVRRPLFLVGLLWLWTLWGYATIVRSWRA